MYIYKYIYYIFIHINFIQTFFSAPKNVKPINVIVRIVIVSFPELITITILTITLVHEDY